MHRIHSGHPEQQKRLLLEHGLLSIHRVPQGSREDIFIPCQLLHEIFRLVRRFSEKDALIIEHILKYRTLSAAARSLAPGRPSYRAYIQKRLKKYRAVLQEALQNSLLGALAQVIRPEANSIEIPVEEEPQEDVEEITSAVSP